MLVCPPRQEDDTQALLARKMFKDAYLNFSGLTRWVCMETNIAGSKEGNELWLVF